MLTNTHSFLKCLLLKFSFFLSFFLSTLFVYFTCALLDKVYLRYKSFNIIPKTLSEKIFAKVSHFQFMLRKYLLVPVAVCLGLFMCGLTAFQMRLGGGLLYWFDLGDENSANFGYTYSYYTFGMEEFYVLII